ncbi:MAG: putative membrane protein YdfK [Chloroflexi bacterium OLB14]|nr:MAG: putative membrane protein YdfK [Chloroflexi bacterium OLB14]
MTGTLINIVAVLIGGAIGLIFGSRIPERFKSTVIAGMGLFTGAIGLQMFLQSENQLIVLGAIIIGIILGEWLAIEDRLQSFGQTLEKRFSPSVETDSVSSTFVRGFMVASLLFCVGPMSILGSIQDGLTGDYQLLAVKSTLDLFTSIAFASTLGIGVLFSSIVVLIYQGGISLLAGSLSAIISDPMMNEMTATGGVILFGLAISNLLEIKKIRVGNFLPALVIAPLIVWIIEKM